MSIALLFKDLHGTLNFDDVIQWKDKEMEKIASLLDVEQKFLFYDPNSILDKHFYFDGLYFFPFRGLDSLMFQMAHADKLLGGGPKESIKKASAYFKRLKDEKRFIDLFDCVDKKVLIKVYTELYNEIPDNQKWESFINLYVRNEFGFDTIPKNILEDLITSQIYKSEERKVRLKELKKVGGKVLQLYRGVAGNETCNPHDEMSWTLSRKTAKFFANRFSGNGKIIKKQIPFSEALDYLDMRNEQEVLINTKINEKI